MTELAPVVIGYLRVELTNASTGPTRRSRCLPKIRMFLLTAAFGGAAALCIMMWLVQVIQCGFWG